MNLFQISFGKIGNDPINDLFSVQRATDADPDPHITRRTILINAFQSVMTARAAADLRSIDELGITPAVEKLLEK